MLAFLAGPAHGQAISEPQTVLVAPFVNASGNPADDGLVWGIAETISTDLARFPTLTVVGHETFLGSPRPEVDGRADDEPVLRRARALGALWLVTGTLRKQDSRLRISARIIDVESGASTHTTEVDGHIDDLFALHDQVVEALEHNLIDVAGVFLAEGDPPTDSRPSGRRGRRGGALGEAPTTRVTPPVADQPSSDAAGLERLSPPLADPPVLPRTQAPTIGVTPGDVTGGLVIEDEPPRLGVAAGVGVLTGRPLVRPPRTEIAPNIDGNLDDAVWINAVRVTNFVQFAPVDGAPATEETEIYIAYDSRHIYLGFYSHYADPGIIRANRADRDRATGDDAFSVYFDPFLDQQRAYVFTVNAYGVQADSILSAGGRGGLGGGGGSRGLFGPPRGDRSWDALFDSAGQFVSDGFTAEMAIPFKSLRYPQRGGDTPHRWGFQVARRIRGKAETVVWSPVSRQIAGFLPQMGVLDGMTALSTSRNIEILPTFTGLQRGSLSDRGGFVNDDPRPEGGINLKYGVTSNLTADVTFNPDFSQIESDRPQIEVNQRFALFFPELRPFFLEGAEIFRTPLPVDLVHTRTIIDPRYGAKLTGKSGNTTIGVMYANDEAPGELEDTADLGQTAQTFVGRVRYDLYSESYIGAIMTNRELVGSHNRVGGFDSNFRLGDTHAVGVSAIGSRDLDLDGLETSGYLLNAIFRRNGRNLSYAVSQTALSPDFETDVGFVRRTDQKATYGLVSYNWWPEHWLVSWGPRGSYFRGYNFDQVLEDESGSAGLSFSFANNVRVEAEVGRDMERFGGINFFKTHYEYDGVISTRLFAVGLGRSGGDQIFFDAANPYLGYETGWDTFLSLRTNSRWRSRIFFDTNRFVDVRNNDDLVFDVKILRTLNTYQFTDRLLFRNIMEYNSFDRRLNLNVLFTYRVNAGTVFYVGYDDRYQQADRITRDTNGDGLDDRFFFSTDLRRTNRAIFTKLQYLFRY